MTTGPPLACPAPDSGSQGRTAALPGYTGRVRRQAPAPDGLPQWSPECSIEPVFDQAAQDNPELVRAYKPARPVWVDLSKAHPAEDRPDKPPSAQVRNRGLTVSGTVQGELHAWVRGAHGGWFGLVSYAVPWFVFGSIPLRQLVPGSAITERRKGETEPPF